MVFEERCNCERSASEEECGKEGFAKSCLRKSLNSMNQIDMGGPTDQAKGQMKYIPLHYSAVIQTVFIDLLEKLQLSVFYSFLNRSPGSVLPTSF